jgi:type III restriction enzyme
MKFHFEPDLDYHRHAIGAVCDLYCGQETCRTGFTGTRDALDGQHVLAFAQSDLGVGSRLTVLDDELHSSLKDIQIRNGLAPSGSLASGDFTLAMKPVPGRRTSTSARSSS